MPPRLTVEISIQALHGLEHLHQMGLIHRDISPENIMLSQDHHGKLLVKVIDFGIAKQLAEGEGGQGLTQTGMFLGKLKYASPEQAGFLKEGEHLDPRSDLYSFGIVMYEMLAGRAPFQATNPHGYILKHVTEKPAPIGETNPGVKAPPQLESVIMKSLEKNRESRYATAGDFAEELESIRASIPPDQKYGVGEKMITLSGAQTLADLPKMTSSSPGGTFGGQQQTQQTFAGQQQTQQTFAGGAGGTMPAQRVGPTGTRVGSDEATVMERNLAGAPGSPKTIGSDEATVMERFGTPGPGATAEATVLEKKYAAEAPKKKNTAMLAAAAVVVALLAIGGYLVMKPKAPSVAQVPQTTAGTDVTTTATPIPVPADQGVLLLSATPWGDLDRIVNTSNRKEIAVEEELRSTPTRIPLAPGQYDITLTGPKGPRTETVQINAGKQTPKHIEMEKVNVDDLATEFNQP
jgi:hypothetical protein